MANRWFVLVGVVAAALILVGSLFSVLGAQASVSLPPTQRRSADLAADLPDLRVSQIEVLTMTASTLEGYYVIQNTGPVTADLDGPTSAYTDNVDFQAILSPDTDPFDADNIGAGGGYIMEGNELGPGEEFTVSINIEPPGVYLFDYNFLFAEVDLVKNLTESNEANNQTMIALPDGPDLVIIDIDVLSINNNDIIYQFVTKNEGDGIADLNNVGFQGYLSENIAFGDGDDIPAGGGTIVDPTELYPGDVFTTSMWAGMLGANYQDYRYIHVMIDPSDALTETVPGESNNLGTGEIPYFLFLPVILR